MAVSSHKMGQWKADGQLRLGSKPKSEPHAQVSTLVSDLNHPLPRLSLPGTNSNFDSSGFLSGVEGGAQRTNVIGLPALGYKPVKAVALRPG